MESALRELADEAEQRSLWLGSRFPGVSSFTECVEMLFSDSGLGVDLERNGVVYSPEIDHQLLELRKLLHPIDDYSRPPRETLEDPNLHLARSMASSILEALKALGAPKGEA